MILFQKSYSVTPSTLSWLKQVQGGKHRSHFSGVELQEEHMKSELLLQPSLEHTICHTSQRSCICLNAYMPETCTIKGISCGDQVFHQQALFIKKNNSIQIALYSLQLPFMVFTVTLCGGNYSHTILQRGELKFRKVMWAHQKHLAGYG